MPIELKLNGKASWDFHFCKGHIIDLGCCVRNWSTSGNPLKMLPLLSSNARSVHVWSLIRVRLSLGNFDLKQKCNACKCSYKVSRWKCTCGSYWHRCHLHRHCWSANKRAERPIRPRVSPSQLCSETFWVEGTQTYEVMLTEDSKRAKRKLQQIDEWDSEPTVVLGHPKIRSIKVASLCQPLKRRFIHPGSEKPLCGSSNCCF